MDKETQEGIRTSVVSFQEESMFNGMKRLLPILVVALLIPQFALAAWWNPFSWNVWRIFDRSNNETQVLEERVKELERKLEETSSSTLSTTDSNEESGVTEKQASTPTKVPIKQTDSQKNVVSPTKIQGGPVNVVYTYSDLIKKYSEFRSIVINELSGTEENSPIESEMDRFAYLKQLEKSLNADLGYLSQISNLSPKPTGVNEIYTQKYDNLYKEYLLKTKAYPINLKNDQASYEQQKKLQEQEAKLNEVEAVAAQIQALCFEATLFYKSATDKKFNRTAEYNQDIQDVYDNGATTQFAQQVAISNLTNMYQLDIAPINLDIQKATRDMGLYCN